MTRKSANSVSNKLVHTEGFKPSLHFVHAHKHLQILCEGQLWGYKQTEVHNFNECTTSIPQEW